MRKTARRRGNPMKLNTIINRYLFREMLSPFLINVMFFTFVFLLTEILQITDMIVNYKISVLAVLLLLAYSMPYFLVFVIPMSVMMAVLLTFLRMSQDNEIIALKAGGVGVYQLMPAVLVLCLIGALATFWTIVWGLPWGRTAVKAKTIEIARSSIDIGLKERTFNTAFDGVMLYVGKIDLKTRDLMDVFIQDERNPEAAVTVIAPRGRIFSDPDRLFFKLTLENGTISQASVKNRSANAIRFDTYEVTLDLDRHLPGGGGPKNEKEMNFSELREAIRSAPEKNARYYSALIEYHKKFSIPFACLALGVLAVPLGMQSKSARKSFGLALGLFLFLTYYLLMSAGVVFGEAGRYPPAIGMWMPNLVTGGIGLHLLVRSVRGRPMEMDAIIAFFRLKR